MDIDGITKSVLTDSDFQQITPESLAKAFPDPIQMIFLLGMLEYIEELYQRIAKLEAKAAFKTHVASYPPPPPK